MTLSAFNLHADAEALLALQEHPGWRVYTRILQAKVDQSLDRMRNCSREDLAENRALWVARVDSLNIPKQVIDQARAMRQKLEV